MQLAFYKAQFGTWVDREIARRTKGPHSHVEAFFDRVEGDCFSSSWRDGGTRFKNIDVRDGHWDLVRVPCTVEAESMCRTWCEGELGRAYDLAGILIFGMNREHKDKWFCSEIVGAALQEIKIIASDFRPWRVSPNRLYQLAQYNWGETNP
jgi:hypothetical protein